MNEVIVDNAHKEVAAGNLVDQLTGLGALLIDRAPLRLPQLKGLILSDATHPCEKSERG